MKSKKAKPIGDPTKIKHSLEVVIEYLEWQKANNITVEETVLEKLKKMRKRFSLY